MSTRSRRTRGETEMLAHAQRLFPGGSLSTLKLPEDLDLVITRGKGARVWDASGREYIDYVLGSGPLILGHAHPAVVEAVQRQAARGSTFYAMNETALALAQEIHEAVPCAEQVRFTGSGSEATFFAMRLARAFTGREKILKFEGGYHGYSDYAIMSSAPRELEDYPRAQPDSAGIPRALEDTVLVAPYNEPGTAARLVDEHRGELAAVIVEPVQREIAPRDGFLAGLREITEKAGVLLIFDEVVTGFRLAYGGAQEFYGVTPDLAALGKTISGGYPLAAVAGRADIMDATNPARKGTSGFVHQSGTFSGNPVCAAAGLATVLELKKPGTYERLHHVGRTLREAVEGLARERGFAARAMGVGPMWYLAFSDREIHNYRDAARHADKEKSFKFLSGLFPEGIFVNPTLRGYCSLAHTDEDLEHTIAAFAASLDRLAAEQ